MDNTKIKVVLKILFLRFNNANVLFDDKTFIFRLYIINKILFIIKQVQIINKSDFAIMVLDKNNKTFFIYIAI